jgi:hypothetical protein
VQYQIEWYVREKIKEGYLTQRSSHLGSPLPYAVRIRVYPKVDGVANLSHEQPSPTLVEMLLEAGVDPNQDIAFSPGLYPPWRTVLYELERNLHNPNWMEIRKLFLKYGADPNELDPNGFSELADNGPDEIPPVVLARARGLNWPTDDSSGEVPAVVSARGISRLTGDGPSGIPKVASPRDDAYQDFPEVVTARMRGLPSTK